MPFFVFLVFFEAMVGSNSSWGQAPLMQLVCMSRLLNVRLVIRDAIGNRAGKR